MKYGSYLTGVALKNVYEQITESLAARGRVLQEKYRAIGGSELAAE